MGDTKRQFTHGGHLLHLKHLTVELSPFVLHETLNADITRHNHMGVALPVGGRRVDRHGKNTLGQRHVAPKRFASLDIGNHLPALAPGIAHAGAMQILLQVKKIVGRCVRQNHGAVRVNCQDGVTGVAEHGRQQRTFGRQFPRAAGHIVGQTGAVCLQVAVQRRQPRRHGVELMAQGSDFVTSAHAHAAGVIALGDDLGLTLQIFQRSQQPAAQAVTADRRHRQRCQQYAVKQVQIEDRLPQHAFRERLSHDPSVSVRCGIRCPQVDRGMGNDVISRLDGANLRPQHRSDHAGT